MALSKLQTSGCPTIGSSPYQPRNITFPKVSFGKSKVVLRAFNVCWFDKWEWLHWDEASERAFCFTCVSAFKQKKLRSGAADAAFITKGYQNWKDATSSFRNHESSACHKEAVEKMVTIPATNRDVGECLSTSFALERKCNQACFLKLISSIRFLARQGLALRGDGSGEPDSNFLQLLKLSADYEQDGKLNEWMKRKSSRYTSHEIQNEILQVMAMQILRHITSNLQTTKFTVMVDETSDVSTIEQVVLVFRWVDSSLEVHEDFVGLYETASITSDSLVGIIKDVMLRFNLKLENCRGQCYDGASSMKGRISGVSTQLLQEEPRAIYTHCYGHSLNLACQDTIRSVKVLRDALDTTFELSKLLKYSSKRNAEYKKIKQQIAPSDPGFRTLCPTRWTVRADSLASVVSNYSVLQTSLDTFADMAHRDMEMSARVNGIAAQFDKFDFLFGLMLGEKVLRLADNLSRTLQQKDLSAAEGNRIAHLTCETLSTLRTDPEYKKFWDSVIAKQESEGIEPPALPRRRKVPKRLEVGSGEPHFPCTIEEHYRVQYFEALDLLVLCIKERFDQPGYKVYSKLETLLLNAASGQEFDALLDDVIELYGDDFDQSLLKSQLQILKSHFSTNTEPIHLSTIKEFLISLGESRSLLSEVVKLINLVLVMPATNATSERSFSALKRVKTFLRSSMKQARLNHLMLLHVHKDLTDGLDLLSCANDFVSGSDHRQQIFGKFCQ